MSDITPTAWLQAAPAKQPDQIAYVVPDLEVAIRTWSALLGRDDWRIYTYGRHNARDLQYRGSDSDYSMRLALCGESPQVELIQSIRGPNIYSEWVDRAGAGLHHIGFFVPSLASLRERLEQLGIEPVQTGIGYGLDGDGGFAYYELPGIEGFVEYIEVPQRRAPSEQLEPALRTDEG